MLFRTRSPEQTSHLFSLPPTPFQSSPPPLLSRKRRLTESNSDEPAVKKPRGTDWIPRKQTASAPLPLPTPLFDWESWCSEAFVLPPLATTNHPVPEALDFELFNFEAFPASQPVGQSEIRSPSSSSDNLLPPSDIADSPADTHLEFPERSTRGNSLCAASSQSEKGLCSTSCENFFNFELPCYSPSLPSLTDSPSSPDPLWSFSPPELSCFDSFESPLFDFSPPSLFKIPTLYPADGIGIVDSSLISL